MVEYATDSEDSSLFPDEGYQYAVVAMDEMKAPDDDDFVVRMGQFEDDDFELPVSNDFMTYWIHTADGETITRDDWEGE